MYSVSLKAHPYIHMRIVSTLYSALLTDSCFPCSNSELLLGFGKIFPKSHLSFCSFILRITRLPVYPGKNPQNVTLDVVM